ncbi:MAG TPA: SxtJ family membrane protein [Gemmatimonadales bacterium]|nr:SxtJ family membrane protein [Gemmatimonadales bacterium]
MADGVPARLNGSARLSPQAEAREGRRFGLQVGSAFLVLAAIARWRGHTTSVAVLGLLGLALVAGGVAMPAHLGPVRRGWMRFALLLSKVTTPIFMGLVYYLVLTPIGFVMRLLGHRPLAPAPGAASRWVARAPDRRGAAGMERQF